jgi:hemolysin activation/secretion protein
MYAAQTNTARGAETRGGGGNGAGSHFAVRSYTIEGKTGLSAELLGRLLAKYTGPDVSLGGLVRAASAVQAKYRDLGYTAISIVIGQRRITNGVVTMNVFEGAFPQIVISGRRYLLTANGVAAAAQGAVARTPSARRPLAKPTAPKPRGPTFAVEHYLVSGNTILPPTVIAQALTNAAGAFGTNVSFGGIQSALAGLEEAYRARGYVTVSVGLPQQRLTNATVRVKVTEGRLAAIRVVGNRYFSSNNVMRSLPSLRTNTILNGHIFQAELDRANGNRDRQIYPILGPGQAPGTSDLTLKVKDRLPLHAKLELNNLSSPGTPDLRLNASAVYDNLWQLEHSIGVQYSLSPEGYKSGDQWNFYDLPVFAAYSAFYRLPLGNPEPIANVVASKPGTFGYNEATRKFNLPPPSGRAELNIYASRATIDTGVEDLLDEVIYEEPGVRSITRQDVQQDITVNEAAGFRLTEPLPSTGLSSSTLSGGLDFKAYSLSDHKTNIFHFSEITYKPDGSPNPPIVSTVSSAVPASRRRLDYLPLSLEYRATWHTPRLTVSPGFGISGNAWYSGSKSNLQSVANSTQASGHWVTLDPSISMSVVVHTSWVLTARAAGQWASEPLISNEQFGAGGVASVRGYREGEVFGDNGWLVSLEQETPSRVLGFLPGGIPLSIRGSIYMDYAETYLLDPQSPPGSVALWGTGVGGILSVGPYWESRLLFSVPLLDAGTTRAYQPYFNFILTAQF